MKECFIISGYFQGNTDFIKNTLAKKNNKFIITADKGYQFLSNFQIVPNIAIGDFDSSSISTDNLQCPFILHSKEKDFTDTHICVDYAIEHGFTKINILGGLGGRIDHEFSNIQTLAWAKQTFHQKKISNSQINIIDEKNFVTILSNETRKFKNFNKKYISLVSFSEKCLGVNASGLKWNLENHVISSHNPNCTSNEFLENEATISVESGELLVILSND